MLPKFSPHQHFLQISPKFIHFLIRNRIQESVLVTLQRHWIFNLLLRNFKRIFMMHNFICTRAPEKYNNAVKFSCTTQHLRNILNSVQTHFPIIVKWRWWENAPIIIFVAGSMGIQPWPVFRPWLHIHAHCANPIREKMTIGKAAMWLLILPETIPLPPRKSVARGILQFVVFKRKTQIFTSRERICKKLEQIRFTISEKRNWNKKKFHGWTLRQQVG